jgi:hypothetical protein
MDAIRGFFISLLTLHISVRTSVAAPSDRLVWWHVREVRGV